jgi:hypothetical protein
MSISVTWKISCDNWIDSDIDECDIKCYASHDGDSFVPSDRGWVNVEYGNGEDEGEHYCPKCAERLGKVDAHA